MRFLWIFPIWALVAGSADAGTPAQAEAVRTAYDKSTKAFSLKMQLAASERERMALADTRPLPKVAAERMWKVIGSDLRQDWTLEHAAWFLRMTAALVDIDDKGQRQPVLQDEKAAIKKAVKAFHLKSSQLAPMCMGLVASGDQESLQLLREIEKNHPDKKVAGVAALGIAMLTKGLGDDAQVMRERLNMLRKAIVESADIEIDGVTVAELAKEELYIIMNLSKGTTAPDLKGMDSGARPMSLSQFSGKVVLLVFWNSSGDGAEGLLEWVDAIRRDERFAGKAFEVVGVNSDGVQTLRKLQADGTVPWPNFSDPENKLGKLYRVGVWPTCYVLGPERKIHYLGTIGTFAELTAAAVLGDN